MYSVVSCPECGQQASVLDRFTLESTDGPVEHLRIRCAGRHSLTMAAAGIARFPASLTSLAS